MSGHLARSHLWSASRTWSAICDACGYRQRADSYDHAEWLADEHYRDTDCHCWDSLSMEFRPEPCPACKRTALPDGETA